MPEEIKDWQEVPTYKINDWKEVPVKPWWVKPARTGMEAMGAIGGGLIGATTGPVGALAGGGLGYAGMKGLADIGEEVLGYKPAIGLKERAIQSGEDIVKGAAMEAGGQVAGVALPTIVKGGQKYAEKIIEKGIEKGIRPSVVGKSTAPQLEKYMDRAKDAVNTIVGSKETLKLTDESGNLIKGELPQTLKQFSQAIDQNKKIIFQKYDKLAKQAGQEGIKVKTTDISKELYDIANSKTVSDLVPETAKYAKKRALTLWKRKDYTPEEAQDAIAILNNNLDAFYKNPSYENASKVSIDAMIANRLRRSLDDTIEKAVGAGYQQLKNTYGSLSTLEKDVTHRAMIDARKNIKGLIDFTDVYSGGEVIRGILSMNPATVGRGMASKAIASTYRYLNDPNRIVKNMFQNVEKYGTRTPRISPQAGRLIGTTGGYMGSTPETEE